MAELMVQTGNIVGDDIVMLRDGKFDGFRGVHGGPSIEFETDPFGDMPISAMLKGGSFIRQRKRNHANNH